jgi:hypothetical protein
MRPDSPEEPPRGPTHLGMHASPGRDEALKRAACLVIRLKGSRRRRALRAADNPKFVCDTALIRVQRGHARHAPPEMTRDPKPP